MTLPGPGDFSPPDPEPDVTDNLTLEDYDEAYRDLIADGWEEPTDKQVEDRAINNYLAKWSDDV